MKQLMTLFCIAAFSLTLLAGCSEDKPAPRQKRPNLLLKQPRQQPLQQAPEKPVKSLKP